MKKSRYNFVWIDLEMTGLEPETDVILEIATIITDDQLRIIDTGPNLVIHHSDAVLETMNAWCVDQHGKSGLTKAVQASTTTLIQAQEATLDFIQYYCVKNTGLLAGSSVWQDRAFLKKYMPTIIEYLYYKLIDVSSIKELANRWYPKHPQLSYEKKEAHRAHDDIIESIELLKHLRTNFFIPIV